MVEEGTGLTSKLREALFTELRFLLFQPARPDLKRLGLLYLAVGLLFSWLAGIGRYWDNERAELWQKLGLGSVAYVFVLAAFLWLILLPLRPANWTLRNVLVFVAMTSPPALLYAIPVERMFSLGAAQDLNVAFLAAVSLWRVTLLLLYLHRSGGLNPIEAWVAALVPLAVIVVALSILNLEHVTFDIMGGIRDDARTGNDAAFEFVFGIGFLALYGLPLMLIAYAWLAVVRFRNRRHARLRAGTGDAG